MQRRSLHFKSRSARARSLIIQPIQFFVLELGDVQFALPLSRIDRVIAKGKVAQWDDRAIPLLDLYRLLNPSVPPIHPTAHYKLILPAPQPWALQVPKIPSLLSLSPDTIQSIPQTESIDSRRAQMTTQRVREVSLIADRFVPLKQGNLLQTLFLLDLPYLETLIWKK